MNLNRVRQIRQMFVLGWLLAQICVAAGIFAKVLRPGPATMTLVIGSAAYIWLLHVVDHRLGLLGFRCLSAVAHKLPAHEATAAAEFRKSLRLEMLAITSGFAATLFLLCIQLYLQWDPRLGERPGVVLEAMAVMFFAASVLNLLQLVMYDFLLRAKAINHISGTALAEMCTHLDKKLSFFRDTSWHALVAPAILAFALINPLLCVAVNAIYGLVLFAYYFFPLTPDAVRYCSEVRSTPQPRPSA